MENSDLVLGTCCEAVRKKMALGKKGEGLGLGFGFVRYTRSMSGKRIAISNNLEVDSTQKMNKQCSEKMNQSSDKSLLEALPQEILIRILYGVDHDDLKQLFHVSKQIREATLIAKKLHFEYNTPKKVPVFQNSVDCGDVGAFEEASVPNAPKQVRSHRPRLSGKKLADISVTLFASPDEERWPRKDLFMDLEKDP